MQGALTNLVFLAVTAVSACVSLQQGIYFRYGVGVPHTGTSVVGFLTGTPQGFHSLFDLRGFLWLSSNVVVLQERVVTSQSVPKKTEL